MKTLEELKEEFYKIRPHLDGCLFELQERYNANSGVNSCTCGLEKEWQFIEEAIKERDEEIEKYASIVSKLLQNQDELLYKPNWEKAVTRRILELRGEGMTLRAIGKKLGMSHENVNLRISKAD